MQVNLFIPGLLSHSIYSNVIMELTIIEMSFIILVVFTVFVLFKYSIIYRSNKLLSHKLNEISVISEKQGKKLAQFADRSATNFKSSIDSVELKTKLQKPRMNAIHGKSSLKNSFRVPEKYSYIRSLSAKGLSADEIASVLSLSPYEARQLVALSTIGTKKG